MKYRLWVQNWGVLSTELRKGPKEQIWNAQSPEDMSWYKIKGIVSGEPIEGAEKVDVVAATSGNRVGEAHFKVLEVVEAL